MNSFAEVSFLFITIFLSYKLISDHFRPLEKTVFSLRASKMFLRKNNCDSFTRGGGSKLLQSDQCDSFLYDSFAK